MNPNADGCTTDVVSSILDSSPSPQVIYLHRVMRRAVKGHVSNLALLYSFLYFLDLNLAESFDFEEGLARSSMNRLAQARRQLRCFKGAQARDKEVQYGDGEVAISF